MGWCELKPLERTNTLLVEVECLDRKAGLRGVLLWGDGVANRRPVHVRLVNVTFTV